MTTYAKAASALSLACDALAEEAARAHDAADEQSEVVLLRTMHVVRSHAESLHRTAKARALSQTDPVIGSMTNSLALASVCITRAVSEAAARWCSTRSNRLRYVAQHLAVLARRGGTVAHIARGTA